MDRSTLARLAAHERWARVPDRTAATAPGRAAAAERFLRQAAELHPGADPDLILKAAENLRSAHAIRAARARWGYEKRTATPAKVTAQEADRVADDRAPARAS